MLKNIKKIYSNTPALFFGYAFQKDIAQRLRQMDRTVPPGDYSEDDHRGYCEITFDDGRPAYISDFKVRNIVCRRCGYEISGQPGTIRG